MPEINKLAVTVAERMNLQPLAVDMVHSQLHTALEQMAYADYEEYESMEERVHKDVCEAYGFDSSQNKPFPFQNGVAVIPIHGLLINRFGSCWGYVTGYNYLRRMRNLAEADEDVEYIIYDINSCGGEVGGVFETAQEAFEFRGNKPVASLVDTNCYSAAYLMAASIGPIFVTPTGGAGSIGVVSMHVSIKKMLENFGFEITFIHSGAHKVDGNPFEQLSDEVKADWQKRVDKTREKFVAAVAEYRDIDAKVIHNTEARCYDADDALEIGLIDGIATAQNVFEVWQSLNLTEDIEMTNKTTKQDQDSTAATTAAAVKDQAASAADTKQDAAAASQESAANERARISSIMNCDAAKGRETLAQHLALNTDVTADSAAAILAASPTDSKQANDNGFNAAMAGEDHPNVSTDAAASSAEDDQDGNDLAASYTAATGYKFDS